MPGTPFPGPPASPKRVLTMAWRSTAMATALRKVTLLNGAMLWLKFRWVSDDPVGACSTRKAGLFLYGSITLGRPEADAESTLPWVSASRSLVGCTLGGPVEVRVIFLTLGAPRK